MHFRDISQVISKHLNILIGSKSIKEAVDHFSRLGRAISFGNPISSKQTQQEFGWHPVQASLLGELLLSNWVMDYNKYIKVRRVTLRPQVSKWGNEFGDCYLVNRLPKNCCIYQTMGRTDLRSAWRSNYT
jgi:hypothetical protein